jgi:serine/threonine protein kinase
MTVNSMGFRLQLSHKRRGTSKPLPLPSIFGRYRLTQLLAKGGMAQIYLAKSFGDEGFVKQLVIKRLDPSLIGNPFFTKLFINEAKLLVTLNHGNIVPVFDFGWTAEDLFIAMEHVPGAALAQVLQAVKGAQLIFPHQLAAYVAAEVCKGLDYAHRKIGVGGRPMGVVHRDIKPTNILVSFEGEVKIVDFGVAKLSGRLDSGPLAGTLSYMSPEQANRQTVDRRTDIFSLGLVLYEMLAGRKAYPERDPKQVLARAQAGELPPFPDHVPHELKAVVTQAPRRDPLARYSSAHEMEQDLTEYLILARSAGATVERVSLNFRLSTLIRELPLKLPESTDEKSLPPLPDPTGSAPSAEAGASGLKALPEAADMEMIQEAADTFHSEFFTRVLQESEPTRLLTSRRIWLLSLALVIVALPVFYYSFKYSFPSRPVVPPRRALLAQYASAPPRAPIKDSKPRLPGAQDQWQPPGKDPQPVRRGERRTHKSSFGFLNLNSFPWSEIWIDNHKLVQHTPLLQFKLSAGRHHVRLVNRDQRLEKSLSVMIAPGDTTVTVIKLR